MRWLGYEWHRDEKRSNGEVARSNVWRRHSKGALGNTTMQRKCNVAKGEGRA